MKILYKTVIMALLLLSLPLMADEEEISVAPLPSITLPSPKLEAIGLDSLSIETKITGNLAPTTYEMGFYNPNSRVEILREKEIEVRIDTKEDKKIVKDVFISYASEDKQRIVEPLEG